MKFFHFSLAAALCCAGPASAQDYFPLQVGNQWVYQSGGAFRGEPFAVEVSGIETIDGADYFLVRGFPGPSMLLRKNDAGTLVLYDRNQRRERTWVAFGAATGEAWRTETDPCNPTAVITTREGEVKSPVGEFQNGLQVRYSIAQCADAGMTSETFLPDVGLVERRATSIAGERVYSLVYARINDSTVVTGRELGFAVALDNFTYAPGDSMLVRMTWRNVRNVPLRMVFPSGQDFEIQIRDGNGEIVYTWSANRAFPLIFRDLAMTGEKNWVARIDIGRGGVELAPGDYTLTASLATPGKYESAVRFSLAAR